jgi:xanthine dehydrogenase accessory factor
MLMGGGALRKPLALILGTNEIASAVAVRMSQAGYACILAHDLHPPVIRRKMAFHDTLYYEHVCLDGIVGRRADDAVELLAALEAPAHVAVTPLHLSDLITLRTPAALIDARMQKYRITPDWRHIARLAVGLGPNFRVGDNCDVAIETKPSKVGALVVFGGTEAPDHKPETLGGVGANRFAYAAHDGLWHSALEIGVRVYKGLVVGHLDGAPVSAPLDGVLRGVARDGLQIPGGVKLLEIDPRGRAACWTGIDPRGDAIAKAVVRAVAIKRAELLAPATFANSTQRH